MMEIICTNIQKNIAKKEKIRKEIEEEKMEKERKNRDNEVFKVNYRISTEK